MNNVEALYKVYRETIEKRFHCQTIERSVIHSELFDNHQGDETNYLAITTDEYGNITLPGELKALLM